jgi:uncharacterized protein YaaQ
MDNARQKPPMERVVSLFSGLFEYDKEKELYMKLLIAIVSKEDASDCAGALTRQGFSITRLASSGGFLRAGSTTFLIGCEDEEVAEALEIIGDNAPERMETVAMMQDFSVSGFTGVPMHVHSGGAAVFVLNVESFHKV